MNKIIDPLKFARMMWPDVTFYDKQREVIYSVAENTETDVPAGNMLGKDFVAGFIVVWFFCSRHPCRIVTTSVKERHLNVLWGEIGRFIQTARHPLTSDRGGPLIVNHQALYKVVKGQRCPLSYAVGLVSSDETAESLQGHHIANTGDGIPRTLIIGDEASALKDSVYDMVSTWANRMLFIGNTWPTDNFFKAAVRGKPGVTAGGPIKSSSNDHYIRWVTRIKAEDSPNVKLGLLQKSRGERPTNEMLVDGVLPYEEYVTRRTTWDKVRQTVSLDADWYEGAENLMFPVEWLDAAERAPAARRDRCTMGIDSAQGGDNTSWAVCSGMGLLHLESYKTPDTSKIVGRTIALAREWNVKPEDVLLDTGGGGKQHADRLRAMGYKVRTVAFGESVRSEVQIGRVSQDQHRREGEARYAYKNRRAEIYHLLRLAIAEPSEQAGILVGRFSLPSKLVNRPRLDGGASLRGQLAPVPLTYDEEGRIYMIPKNRRDQDSDKPCLSELIGCSPDEADALVLANYGLTRKRLVLGAMR